MQYGEYKGKVYDARHGGPFDRGSADSYYGRAYKPHYYTGASYDSPEVTREQMSPEELEAYDAGYNWNEEFGDKKDWG